MRHRSSLVALALLAFVSAVACAPAVADVAVGATAPAFSLQDIHGKTVSLADFKGKPVVLEWINPNCPFSRKHSEAKTMASTATKHPEAVWLGINSTNASHKDFLPPAEHKAFNEKNGVSYDVLYDSNGAIGKAYGAKTTPHMIIVDKDGKVAYNGAIDDGASSNYVDAALVAMAGGKSPDPSTTKPYGCSVKY